MEKSIGGIWEKVSKKGVRFLSGSIEIEGVKHKFTAFRNSYKKPDNNQPDYQILPAMEFKDVSRNDSKPETSSRRQEDDDINGDQELPF